MTTHTTNPSLPPLMPSSRATWAGRLSFVLAAAGMILICLNDPYWLAMPTSLAATVLGLYALRHGQDQQVTAHWGFNLSLLNLLMWFIFIVFIQGMLDTDLWLWEVPTLQD